MKLVYGLCGLLISSSLLSACNNEQNHPQNLLRVDIGAEPPTLDPAKSEDMNSTRIMYDLFAGLVDFNQQNQLIPGLAKKWEVSSDGKTYTFHLRDNLKFSDGSPISASDFVYSWRRLVDPHLASSYNMLLSGVVNGQDIINGKKPITDLGVEAPNATTFVVHLVNADSSFLDKITLPNLGVVSAKNIQKYAKKWTDPSNMVTSGAYKLTQHVVNGYVLASKNPYYYDAQNVAINQVKYFPYIDANSAVAAYKAGDLDTTFELLPIEQYKQLKTEFKDQVHTVQLEAMAFYDFNMQDPELGKNLKLRQALSMAVDRDALVNNLFQDGKKPLYSAVTATVSNGQYASLAYPWATWSREKRLAQAKQLYNEAGYSVAKPYKVTMLYTNDMYKKISIALAAMWKDSLGVQVTLQPQDWKTFLQSRHTGQYQIARGGWFADYNNVTTYTLLYKCGSTINDTHWCDSEYNRLISQGDMAVNKAEQYKNYSQALQRVQDAYIVLPLFQLTFDRMVKPYVKNYQLDNNYLDRTQSKWLKFN